MSLTFLSRPQNQKDRQVTREAGNHLMPLQNSYYRNPSQVKIILSKGPGDYKRKKKIPMIKFYRHVKKADG